MVCTVVFSNDLEDLNLEDSFGKQAIMLVLLMTASCIKKASASSIFEITHSFTHSSIADFSQRCLVQTKGVQILSLLKSNVTSFLVIRRKRLLARAWTIKGDVISIFDSEMFWRYIVSSLFSIPISIVASLLDREDDDSDIDLFFLIYFSRIYVPRKWQVDTGLVEKLVYLLSIYMWSREKVKTAI